MLVPGYLGNEEVKALAKLSGLNPAEVKYKRPETPGKGGTTQHPLLPMEKNGLPTLTTASAESPQL